MKEPYKEPYKGTDVPIERSQGKIRQMLEDNGAVIVQFSDSKELEMAEIKWARKVFFEQGGQKVPMVQPCRIRVSFKGKKIQQVYRALYWHLKSKFEVVRFGILSFEEEFLPYFITQLDDGRQVTIAERMVPWLKKGEMPDMEPLMLPEKSSRS